MRDLHLTYACHSFYGNPENSHNAIANWNLSAIITPEIQIGISVRRIDHRRMMK